MLLLCRGGEDEATEVIHANRVSHFMRSLQDTEMKRRRKRDVPFATIVSFPLALIGGGDDPSSDVIGRKSFSSFSSFLSVGLKNPVLGGGGGAFMLALGPGRLFPTPNPAEVDVFFHADDGGDDEPNAELEAAGLGKPHAGTCGAGFGAGAGGSDLTAVGPAAAAGAML